MRDDQIEEAQREIDAQCEGHPVKALSKSGYHASKRLIDALKYAPGNRVCRVPVSTRSTHGNQEVVMSGGVWPEQDREEFMQPVDDRSEAMRVLMDQDVFIDHAADCLLFPGDLGADGWQCEQIRRDLIALQESRENDNIGFEGLAVKLANLLLDNIAGDKGDV